VAFQKIKYNCKAAQESGLKLQAKTKIGVKAWLAMKYHLIFCKFCRWFLKQSKVIDKAIVQHKDRLLQNPVYKLSDAEKAAMEKEINSQ